MDNDLEIRLLGPARVLRRGVEIPLPRSRKVRTLLAFLTLAQTATTRSRLIDLLWDVPNDPRGELRWCLSKLRSVLDDTERSRVVTEGQTLVSLDLAGVLVDVREIDRVTAEGVAKVPTDALLRIEPLFAGDLLDGMSVDGLDLTAWLTGHRQHYRALHLAVVSELTTRLPGASEETFGRLQGWLRLAPFDRTPHEVMIDALVKAGRVRDAEAHVNATIRAFEQEGLDWAPVRERWLSARRASAEVTSASAPVVTSAPTAASAPPAPPTPLRHGSVVVMPFVEEPSGSSQVANGLTDDVITRLAKLRLLFVIARGTAYALRERGVDPREAGRILNVAYAVSGVVRRDGERMTVLVELVDTESGAIVWTEELEGAPGDTFAVLDRMVDRIVAAISDEIERAECKRAVIKQPSSLDAWEAYHRGLWHMYKFTGPDNEIGARFFREAIKLDPSFARAYAGLSFTHFQNVFLGLTPDREHQIDLALDTANSSLGADDRDPTAHWAVGRALWLRGDQGESLDALRRSVELSPNFALGHYTLGFVQGQSGDPHAAIAAADYSRELSPFDPLQFGMLGSRAIAHMRLGEREAAADFAVKAASRPNAHTHILAIAATNLALANRLDQARAVVARIKSRSPGYSIEEFLRAFRFAKDGEKLLRQGAKAVGLE